MRALPAHVQRRLGSDYLSLGTDAGAGSSIGLFRYHARVHQAPHFHEFTTLSLLLAGSLREKVETRTHEMHGAAWGYKPPGCLHSDTWTRDGGLIFSIKLDSFDTGRTPQFKVGWEGVAITRELMAIMRTCFLANSVDLRSEALADLLSSADRSPVPHGRDPPIWLRRIYDEMTDSLGNSTVAAAAFQAGVHRSHVTRLFKWHYGVSPSIYRNRVRLARAVAALFAERSSLSAIAAETGFSDQPHMTRSLVAQTGFTPSALRRWFGDICSRSARN